MFGKSHLVRSRNFDRLGNAIVVVALLAAVFVSPWLCSCNEELYASKFWYPFTTLVVGFGYLIVGFILSSKAFEAGKAELQFHSFAYED